MKKISIIFVLFTVSVILHSNSLADLSVADVFINNDGFVYINLENRSNVNITFSNDSKEKIFLTIYINQLKRAEYKFKYIDKRLFKANGGINFRTNFRGGGNLIIKVEINRERIIPETNYRNNTLIKTLKINAKR